MSSCIFTVIKNEHQYLDEWIKYHLDLGIDAIFIYEDVGSDSHLEITQKYPQVILDQIPNLLTEKELSRAIELKRTSGINPQPLYITRGLQHIQNLNPHYDWCFVIDNDEFITFENPNDKLDILLVKYESYDAVILSWECYGASGRVEKPDYTEKGVVATYTEKMQGYVPVSAPKSLTKTCYNLNRYHINRICQVHQPSLDYNCCRTDLSQNRERRIYKYLYLRHYITKSWEEFLWKRTARGFLFGGPNRDLDAFFKMNPDMRHLRSKLINQPTKNAETLVILPFIQQRMQGKEIYLALKGWKKFCKFKYFFVVVGDFDEDLRKRFPWVMFIQAKSVFNQVGQYNPHLDIQNKINIVRERFKDRFPGFIYMTDDIYAIKPFYLSDILTIHYHSSSFSGTESAPTNFWTHDKWKTRQLLDKEGLPHVNYTTHFPFYFDFEKLNDLWQKYNMLKESYVFEDVYFNAIEHEPPVIDSNIRLGIWSHSIYHQNFDEALTTPNIKFVCNSVRGWSKELEKSLSEIIEH